MKLNIRSPLPITSIVRASVFLTLDLFVIVIHPVKLLHRCQVSERWSFASVHGVGVSISGAPPSVWLLHLSDGRKDTLHVSWAECAQPRNKDLNWADSQLMRRHNSLQTGNYLDCSNIEYLCHHIFQESYPTHFTFQP